LKIHALPALTERRYRTFAEVSEGVGAKAHKPFRVIQFQDGHHPSGAGGKSAVDTLEAGLVK
jgi:hypothetical protein